MKIIVTAILLLLAIPVFGDVYQYTDSNGVITFVDDEGKIPEKIRKKKRTIAEEAKPSRGTTNVTIRNNQIIMPVVFSNKGVEVTANMTLDTGASSTLIYSSLANRLNLASNTLEKDRGMVANGAIVEVYKTRIDYIKVGDRILDNPEVAVMDTQNRKPSDGLLGNDFLQNHRFRIDYRNHLVIWE